MDNYFLSEVAELIPSFLTSVHSPRNIQYKASYDHINATNYHVNHK